MDTNEAARTRAILPDFFGGTLSKSQRTQVRIAESAIRVLGECAFEEFRLEAVATTAGVSRPLILHYFKDGDRLFYFTVQFIRARLHHYIVDALCKPQNAQRQFQAYIQAHFRWLEQHALDGKVWILFLHQASKEKRSAPNTLREMHTELAGIGRARIAALLASQFPHLAAGKRKKAAQNIQDLLTGALTAKAIQGGAGSPTVRSVLEACFQLTDR
jgi:AcrR family transcriptional regulator